MDKDYRPFEMFTAFVKQYQSGSSDAVITQGKEFQGTGQAGGSQELVLPEDDDVAIHSDKGTCISPLYAC